MDVEDEEDLDELEEVQIPNQVKVKMTLTAVCNEVYCPDGHDNQADLHHCG